MSRSVEGTVALAQNAHESAISSRLIAWANRTRRRIAGDTNHPFDVRHASGRRCDGSMQQSQLGDEEGAAPLRRTAIPGPARPRVHGTRPNHLYPTECAAARASPADGSAASPSGLAHGRWAALEIHPRTRAHGNRDGCRQEMLGTSTSPRSRSAIEDTPRSRSVRSTSSRKMDRTRLTPGSPAAAKP